MIETLKEIEAACAKKNYKLAIMLCQKLALEFQILAQFQEYEEIHNCICDITNERFDVD